MNDMFYLEELWYFPMGEHTPVYNRPYTVNASKDAIDTLVDRKLSTNSTTIDGTITGDLTSQLIAPNASGEVSIVDQGWVTDPKFIFLLKVRSTDALGMEKMSYIQGFTNYNGISSQGSADPEMIHNINSIIETSKVTIPTPMGMIVREKLHKIYNVHDHHGHEFFTQRPSDVLDNMELLGLHDALSDSNVEIVTSTIGGVVGPFHSNVVSSNVNNSIPTDYLTTVLNSAVNVANNRDIFAMSDNIVDKTDRGHAIIDPSINDNRFVKALSLSEGFRVVHSEFRLAALYNFDPTIESRFKLINITKGFSNPNGMATPDTGEYWHGTDPVTVKAYSLIESFVALATSIGCVKLSFNSTNMATPTAEIVTVITDANSFINLDDRDMGILLDRFKNKATIDIILPETDGGVRPIYLEMYVDLLGTSKIYLEYSGFPGTWYTIPTSANSLFSPVMTFDKNALDAMTLNFKYLTDNILATEVEASRIYY